MKRIEFSKDNRSDDLLHIELPGCVVNIRVNLTDLLGRPVTRVDILPEDETRSPDLDGYYWRLHADGVRVIRDIQPGMHVGDPDPQAWECRHCGADIEQGSDGLWFNASPAWAGLPEAERGSDYEELACPSAPQRGVGYPGLHEPDTDSRAWQAGHS